MILLSSVVRRYKTALRKAAFLLMKIKERSDYNFLNPAIGGGAAIPNERTLKI